MKITRSISLLHKSALAIFWAALWLCTFVFPQSGPKFKRTNATYTLPDVTLSDQDGKSVQLQSFVKGDKIILLDFFYSRCKTVCPILSTNFANFQYRLRPDTSKVHLVSITIDPEYDSPEVLAQFQHRYRAAPGWSFLTGSRENIDRVMKVFSAHTKNRMGFYPLVFMYVPQKQQWFQYEGYISVGELIEEYKNLTNNK